MRRVQAAGLGFKRRCSGCRAGRATSASSRCRAVDDDHRSRWRDFVHDLRQQPAIGQSPGPAVGAGEDLGGRCPLGNLGDLRQQVVRQRQAAAAARVRSVACTSSGTLRIWTDLATSPRYMRSACAGCELSVSGLAFRYARRASPTGRAERPAPRLRPPRRQDTSGDVDHESQAGGAVGTGASRRRGTPPERAVSKQHAKAAGGHRPRAARPAARRRLVRGDTTALAVHRATGFGLEDIERILGDGVVTGHGTVDGRRVCVFSQDFTVFGGPRRGVRRKIVKVMDLAVRMGVPIIKGSTTRAGRASRRASWPWAATATSSRATSARRGWSRRSRRSWGRAPAGRSARPRDHRLHLHGERDLAGTMFITGPEVIKTVTGEDVAEAEELGGAMSSNAKSGVAQISAAEDEESHRRHPPPAVVPRPRRAQPRGQAAEADARPTTPSASTSPATRSCPTRRTCPTTSARSLPASSTTRSSSRSSRTTPRTSSSGSRGWTATPSASSPTSRSTSPGRWT